MIESWDSFFVAETAAAAALLGLLFVAVSINLKQVLEAGGLADRAMGALLLLLCILIIGLLMAMPDQPLRIIGSEIVGVTIVTGIISVMLGVRGLRQAEAQHRAHFAMNIIGNLVALLPVFAGGVVVFTGGEAGFYLVGIGMCLCIVKAVSEGWVFLVEIDR